VNVGTKEQSKQWMHTHSPNKMKKFKQTYARKMAAVFWDREGVLMVVFMQQGDHNNVRSILRNTKKKTAWGHSEQKARNADIRFSAST
jgi:hypothetical protein